MSHLTSSISKDRAELGRAERSEADARRVFRGKAVRGRVERGGAGPGEVRARKAFRGKTVRGFSLVELLLVVALISVLGGMFVIIDPSFIIKNDVELSGAVVTESLRRARTLSTASSGDSRWGVHMEEGSVVIFKGESFTERDVSFDEETVIPSAVNVSGVNEIVFSKLRGEPSETGTITLSSDQDHSIIIEVNEKGAVLH